MPLLQITEGLARGCGIPNEKYFSRLFKAHTGLTPREYRKEMYYNIMFQNNAQVINSETSRSGFDSPEAIGAIQFLHDLIHKYKVSPTVQQMADTKPNIMFSSGKLAMYYTGAWNVSWLSKMK